MNITHLHRELNARKAEKGFTLVELAIVMIIIGLLITGVLKGQEMIGNAQVTATISQLKAFEAATTTFQDMFDAMPGDIIGPDVRLPNCTTGSTCDVDGDSDGTVDTAAALGAARAARPENANDMRLCGMLVRLRLATNVVRLCDCMYRSKRQLVHKSSHTRTTHPSRCLAQVHESRERKSTKMRNLRKRTLVACHQGLVRMTPRHAPHVDSYTGCTGSTLQE